jgi:hypothetical protein|tara:strand:- start:818 stop:1786 length:969 start_codon:yes stop_codon:yes gene_type:complete
MADENATVEGPSSNQFFLDMDGQGNSSSPEAQAAAAAKLGQGVAVEDSLNDAEMDAILSGDFDQAVTIPDGEAQEIGEPEVSGAPTEGGGNAEIAQLTANMNQMGTAIAMLLKDGAARQAGNAPELSSDESIETVAKAALQKVNPGMDDDGIDWLYQNNRAVMDAAVAPIQAKLDRYEANDNQRVSEGNVQQFYATLGGQITKEGVADVPENAPLRQMITENVVARFAANPKMTPDRLPAIVKDVKGTFTKLLHGTTEGMRTVLGKANDLDTNPPPSGRGGPVGREDLTKRAVTSKRKDMDFGGTGSLAIVKGILSRGTLNT